MSPEQGNDLSKSIPNPADTEPSSPFPRLVLSSVFDAMGALFLSELYLQPIEIESLEFVFGLGEHEYLSFKFRTGEGKFAAVRISHNENFPSQYIEGTSDGEFTHRVPMDNAPPPPAGTEFPFGSRDRGRKSKSTANPGDLSRFHYPQWAESDSADREAIRRGSTIWSSTSPTEAPRSEKTSATNETVGTHSESCSQP